MDEERSELIKGLREFADFLESNEAAPTPLIPRFDCFLYSKEELAEAAKAAGGRLEKIRDYDNTFVLRKQFGPVQYDLNIQRDAVCERVVVGTRVIPAEPERVVPATEERIEDIVEWRCGEVLR